MKYLLNHAGFFCIILLTLARNVTLEDLDECDDVEISELTLTPTDEHIAQFKKEVDELVAEYPIHDGLFDNPTVFITWGSS